MTSILRDELSIDPLTRGYSGMSDRDAATDINTSYRTRNKISLTRSEVLSAVDETELDGLTNANEARFWDIIDNETLDPFGKEKQLMQTIFGGAGSTTITALAALRVESITRAIELGLGSMTEGQVGAAR